MEFPTTYEYYNKFKTKNVFTPFIVAKSDKDFLNFVIYLDLLVEL